jgi:hypothetical protein
MLVTAGMKWLSGFTKHSAAEAIPGFRLQAAYDLAQAMKNSKKIRVERIRRAA